MKLLNRPSIAFIDYVSYRQLIDRRLIVDIPSLHNPNVTNNTTPNHSNLKQSRAPAEFKSIKSVAY